MNAHQSATHARPFLTFTAVAVTIIFLLPTARADLQNVTVGGELRIRPSFLSVDATPTHRPWVWGLIDHDGTMLIEPRFSAVSEFSEGLSLVTVGPSGARGSWGFVDKTGKPALGLQTWRAQGFSNGLAAIRDEDGLWGYIDHSGDWAIMPQFSWAKEFEPEAALALVDDAWGVINRNGEFIVPPQYDEAWGISEGLVCVKNGDQCGFVDLHENVVVPLEFENVQPFYEGVAAAQQGGIWGLINRNGEFVIPPAYRRMTGFP